MTTETQLTIQEQIDKSPTLDRIPADTSSFLTIKDGDKSEANPVITRVFTHIINNPNILIDEPPPMPRTAPNSFYETSFVETIEKNPNYYTKDPNDLNWFDIDPPEKEAIFSWMKKMGIMDVDELYGYIPEDEFMDVLNIHPDFLLRMKGNYLSEGKKPIFDDYSLINVILRVREEIVLQRYSNLIEQKARGLIASYLPFVDVPNNIKVYLPPTPGLVDRERSLDSNFSHTMGQLKGIYRIYLDTRQNVGDSYVDCSKFTSPNEADIEMDSLILAHEMLHNWFEATTGHTTADLQGLTLDSLLEEGQDTQSLSFNEIVQLIKKKIDEQGKSIVTNTLVKTIGEGVATMGGLFLAEKRLEELNTDNTKNDEKIARVMQFRELVVNNISRTRFKKDESGNKSWRYYPEGSLAIVRKLQRQIGIEYLPKLIDLVDWNKCIKITWDTEEYRAILQNPLENLPIKNSVSLSAIIT